MTSGTKDRLPKWDLTPVYTDFDDPKYAKTKESLIKEISKFKQWAENSESRKTDPKGWIKKSIDLYNKISDIYEDLYDYAYARFSADIKNATAVKELNILEEISLPFKQAEARMRTGIAALSGTPIPEEYRFFIKEQILLSTKQMSPSEEDLANDLSRAGGDAWSRLQEAVSGNCKTPPNEKTGESKSLVELRALAFHRDRKIREKAFYEELALLKQVEIPMAFALNGVKGFSCTLDKRRKYSSSLNRSVIQSRITEKTLEALIYSMEESLPVFRKYLKAKAEILGIPKCAFYDLFAPIGKSPKTWSFSEAEEFIVNHFARFSGELADFASGAFRNNWIDAELRDGKIGGAYCIAFPLTLSTRVFCNFNGSFNSVTTLAHELGHAYHHEVIKENSAVHRAYPMTLAETASIFAENIIYEGALETMGETERTVILEQFIQGSTQIIVDILSRFYFEQEVFKNRIKGELSPEELCRLMLKAQKKTYGEGIDEDKLHPYMWAVKGHYYNQNRSFYNYPYAFGLLFGLGLFSIYRKEGPVFSETYKRILGNTGKMSANDVFKTIGFDIEDPDFWQQGLSLISDRIEEFISFGGGQ